ncbi:MAG TPA: hypothetical protein VG692_08245 [Gemmatimonadales bacterium]|nr:hypothetical protein [Gemmatimonadales bacterium]
MPHRPLTPAALVLGAMVLTLGACSDSSSPADTTDALTTTQAQELGQDVAEDAGDLSDLSIFNVSTGINVDAASTLHPGASLVPPACITVSPNPPTNSDADIVPDSVRLTYQCGFERAGGQIHDSLTGAIDFLDPQPTVVSAGVRHVFHDFTRRRINTPFPLRSFTAVHNGTREWGGNADTLGHTITNFVTVYTHASGRQTTHEKNWVGKFTATTPGAIVPGAPLPAGSWTLDGTSSWTTLNRSWSVVVSTTEALQYDPSCQVTPRFTNGTLNLLVTRNGVDTNVEITFINCGQYQVTKSVPTV